MTSATYDTANMLVVLDQIMPISGVVEISVQRNLYSDAKEQWLNDLSLNRFIFPWRVVGGDPLPGGAAAPSLYFLKPPWKMQAYDEAHQLNIARNLFSDDGSSLFVPTPSGAQVEINVTNDFGTGDPRLDRILAAVLDTTAADAVSTALGRIESITNGLADVYAILGFNPDYPSTVYQDGDTGYTEAMGIRLNRTRTISPTGAITVVQTREREDG